MNTSNNLNLTFALKQFLFFSIFIIMLTSISLTSLNANEKEVYKSKIGKKIHLLKFICNEKNDVTGYDEIYLKVDGIPYINNRKTQSGDIVDLSFIPPLPLSQNAAHTVTILEEDLFIMHTLLSVSFFGDQYESKQYRQTFSWEGLLGDYELIYEIR